MEDPAFKQWLVAPTHNEIEVEQRLAIAVKTYYCVYLSLGR